MEHRYSDTHENHWKNAGPQIQGADRIFNKRTCSRYWHIRATSALCYFCFAHSKNTLPPSPCRKTPLTFSEPWYLLFCSLIRRGNFSLESEADFGIIQRFGTRSIITSSHSRSGSLQSLRELLRDAYFHPPPP